MPDRNKLASWLPALTTIGAAVLLIATFALALHQTTYLLAQHQEQVERLGDAARQRASRSKASPSAEETNKPPQPRRTARNGTSLHSSRWRRRRN